MDISTLVPLPVRISPELCKLTPDGARVGAGVAVCADLGLLVISSCNKLQVFALPEDMVATTPRELELVRTLGGVSPMEFQFSESSGNMAFTDGVSRRFLLVTDGSYRGTVHVVDAVRGLHVGYVAAPGTILHSRGVATRKSLVAVSCWETGHNDVVRVFEGSSRGSGNTWTAVRDIACGFDWPRGLRFTADGLRLVVANDDGGRLSIFCAKDGAVLRHISLPPDEYFIAPWDVEECNMKDGDGCSAGWVICHHGGLVAVADSENAIGADAVVKRRTLYPDCICFALAAVPALGVLAARHETGVQFFATPDAVAMASMSSCKVAWMAAVRRGVSRQY